MDLERTQYGKSVHEKETAMYRSRIEQLEKENKALRKRNDEIFAAYKKWNTMERELAECKKELTDIKRMFE